MPRLPSDDPTDALRLADWLELSVLSTPRDHASEGDLERALQTATLSELADDERIEQKIAEVFHEMEERKRAAGEAYPFDIDYRGVIRIRASGWMDFPVYSFCLCLSYLPLRDTNVAPKLFEEISCIAARSFIHGEAVGFGPPRTDLPSSFCDAVTELCTRMGEGTEFFEQLTLDRKDDTLDLVAWKDFIDRRPSKLILFGQCGAGRNWLEKLADLQPVTFWNQWMRRTPVSPYPVKSFFTPYRVAPEKWDMIARKAGLLFDRCRIAHWSHGREADYSAIVEWTYDFLAQDNL